MIRDELKRLGPELGRFAMKSQCSCPILLLWTQYGHALQIPRQADQRPFVADVVQSA